MSIFVKSTPAPTPKTANSKFVSLLFAGLLVIFAVTQLWTFQDFLQLIQNLNLPGGLPQAPVIGAAVVLSEIFAIPFLVGWRLSRAARWCSLAMGWLVGILWAFISLWIIIHQIPTNIGFLGTLVDLIPGWWAFFVSLALICLAAWASYGMWPVKRKK